MRYTHLFGMFVASLKGELPVPRILHSLGRAQGAEIGELAVAGLPVLLDVEQDFHDGPAV